MSTTVTCPSCQQPWAVVAGSLKAHPGHRSETVTVRVPDKDVFGRAHGPVLRESSHWVTDGPSATLERSQTDQETVYGWACLCGEPLTHAETRWYVVTCTWQDGGTGMCAKAAIRKNPPADLYVNARYGWACECCGQQGTHLVPWGQAAPCGTTP